MSMSTEKRRVYFTMVLHPARGWIRVGNAYASQESAKSWLSFVRGSWRGCRARVAQCTLRLVDGKPDSRSLAVLDKKFNMDAPAEKAST